MLDKIWMTAFVFSIIFLMTVRIWPKDFNKSPILCAALLFLTIGSVMTFLVTSLIKIWA